MVRTNRFKLLRPDEDAGDPALDRLRTDETLRATARQQEAVAHLGQQALAGVPVPTLMETAVALVARGLEVEFSNILELRPENRTMLLKAGVGWAEGCVGRASVTADIDSVPGYTLRAPGPVVVVDLPTDARFSNSALLAQHAVVSGLSVVIHGKERPFGVLGAFTTRRREFTSQDVPFLQAVANVLGTAIERARTEEALRRSEEHFRSLIDNASDIVTILGDDGMFRYASPSVERLLGYEPRELLGRNAFELVHPDDLAVVAEALTRAIQQPGIAQSAEFRFRHRVGSWRVLEAVGQARLDQAGAVSLIVNSRDVTERKRQERALRESKERLRTLVAGAPLVLFALDRNGVFTLAEGKGLDALGVRPGLLVGRSVFELYADLPQALAEARRALAGEAFSSTVEVFGVVFEARYLPIRDAGGGVAGVIGVAIDITEQKRAEEALRRSEESNRALVQHATYGIFRSTPEGKLLAVNPALVKMLGYESEAALLAADLGRDVYADPSERARILARFEDGGSVVEGAEVTWKRKDGEAIPVRLSGRAVRKADGAIECFETLAEDVTDRRALEEQLRHSQKMEALGQLTGGIAHDFNNLLTIILANAELISKGLGPERAELQADLRDVISAALGGRMMIKELLGFARRSSLDLQPMHLGGVVADVSGMLRRILPEDIEISIAAEDDLSEVRADARAAEQILFNLVTNARDAMPHGGVLRIETRRATIHEPPPAADGAVEPGTYVCLSVADTGVGMDEATRQRVFEPFFTTKPLGQGTGLGLASVYGLVKQHGGFIRLDSEPGRGTRVQIYFPTLEAAPVARGTAGSQEVRGGTETILVVEDESQLRRAAKRVLEQHGYRVLAAADGQEALGMLRRQHVGVDLVLSDLVMPRLGGLALYDAVRREGKSVPFLFASGHSPPGGRGSDLPDPALPFLPKPWTPADLLARVREVLDRG